MPKSIVVCSDGTGCIAAKNRGTNVFKLFEAIDLHGHKTDQTRPRQLAFYDDGVGTSPMRIPRLLGAAFGWGLSRNVRQLYAAIVRSYEPGDRLFFFGFSRGAFTVRTLAGMICRYGILDPGELEDPEHAETSMGLGEAVNRLYNIYRLNYTTAIQRFFDRLSRPFPGLAERRARRCNDIGHRLHREKPHVRFIGVWDTVDAVGLPVPLLADLINSVIYRFKFPDRYLHERVDIARHALSIDDERHTYHPILWNESGESTDRTLQVWFAGAHTNVGGGCARQGMSLVSLDWMMTEAAHAGLRFITPVRELYRSSRNVFDKLYDSRGGLCVFYRYMPRDICELARKHGMRVLVHRSALERALQRTEGYSPGNIPRCAGFIETGTNPLAEDRTRPTSPELTECYCAELDRTAKEIRRGGVRDNWPPSSALSLVFGAKMARNLSHLAALVAVVGLGIIAVRTAHSELGIWIPKTLANGLALAGALSRGLKAGSPTAITAAALLGVLVAYAAITWVARRRMKDVFVRFWCGALQQLRERMPETA